MAASASPTASQLKSSFPSSSSSLRVLIAPRGISGSPLQKLPSRRVARFTVQAIQADKVSWSFHLSSFFFNVVYSRETLVLSCDSELLESTQLLKASGPLLSFGNTIEDSMEK